MKSELIRLYRLLGGCGRGPITLYFLLFFLPFFISLFSIRSLFVAVGWSGGIEFRRPQMNATQQYYGFRERCERSPYELLFHTLFLSLSPFLSFSLFLFYLALILSFYLSPVSSSILFLSSFPLFSPLSSHLLFSSFFASFLCTDFFPFYSKLKKPPIPPARFKLLHPDFSRYVFTRYLDGKSHRPTTGMWLYTTNLPQRTNLPKCTTFAIFVPVFYVL